MKFYLIVAKGSKRGFPIPITVDLFLVGSDKMCQLRKDSLGTKHCAFVTRGKKVFVQDLDSGHLTFVNNSAMPPGAEWPLHAGDRIEIGSLEFMIQVQEKALSRRDLEEWAAGSLDHDSNKGIGDEEDVFHKPTDASAAAQNIISALQVMKGKIEGRLRLGQEGNVHVARINDHNLVEESEIALIKKELCEHFDRPNLRVLVDLKNVRRMSTAGVIMLSDINRRLRHKGSHLALCRIRPEIEHVMGALHVDNIPHFGDKHQALLAKW